MEDYENPVANDPAASPLANNRLPLALIAIAFCVFLFAQISNLGQASRSLAWQAGNLDRQLVSLSEQEKRFNELIKQRETLVEQSKQVQTRYTDMLNDLLALAEVDSDASSVVEKYRIQRQQKPAEDKESAEKPESATTP